MLTQFEKIETKKYILDSVEIDALKLSIMIIKDLDLKNFSTSEFYSSFDSVTDVLNAILDNNDKKLEKNNDTDSFELEEED